MVVAKREAVDLEPCIDAVVKKAKFQPRDFHENDKFTLHTLENIQTQNGGISFYVIKDGPHLRISTSDESGDLKTFRLEDWHKLWDFASKLQKTDEWIIRHIYICVLMINPIEGHQEDMSQKRFRRSVSMLHIITDKSHRYQALLFNIFALKHYQFSKFVDLDEADRHEIANSAANRLTSNLPEVLPCTYPLKVLALISRITGVAHNDVCEKLMLLNFKNTSSIGSLEDFLKPECLTITSPFRDGENFIMFKIPYHIQQMALDMGHNLLVTQDKLEGYWGGTAWKIIPAQWSEDHEKIRKAVKELLASPAHHSSEPC